MLTQDEAELYDRQIRLWGVSAQSRLRQSKVLMLGFNGVASEVAKILVLAGVNALTIVDDQPLQESDLTSNLFCRPTSFKNDSLQESLFRTHQVKEKLRTLNPLVNVNIENVPILSKKPTDFKDYDLVSLHSFMPIDDISMINRMCRSNNVKFYLVLDFGFFGFMFNDLGPKFEYTFEEFDEIPTEQQRSGQTPTLKQSGEGKDPINIDDEDNCDDDCDDNRTDSNRPKKRRRHNSPNRQDQPKDKNEKRHKVGKLSYVTFEDMIRCQEANFDKKSSPVLFISIAMLKFFTEYKRLPKNLKGDNTTESDDLSKRDLSKLNEIIASLRDSFSLHEAIFKRLDPEWSLNINGSLSPVCAIVGGIAGQDMIRSLSNKDVPICNTFSFNGMDMSGIVEQLGIKSERAKTVAPIVRDYLEID